jgi:antitoxin VapB
MAFHIKDRETDRVVRELAALKGLSLTQAVRVAAEEELARARRAKADRKVQVQAAIREIQQRVAARGATGLKADKAFYDWLSGDE